MPEATWRYYKTHPLDSVSIFGILKHFEKPPYFMESYTQLLQLGMKKREGERGEIRCSNVRLGVVAPGLKPNEVLFFSILFSFPPLFFLSLFLFHHSYLFLKLWGDAITSIHKKLAAHGMKFETKKVKLNNWDAWQKIKLKEVYTR